MEKLDVIVSMTSWKGRIADPNLPKVFFRLLEQQETKYNYKVVLVLSTEEFPNKEKELPEDLLAIFNHPKAELLWTDKNTKALKKLMPTMRKYTDVPIITIDDDMLVKQNMVQVMVDEHLKTPDTILGTVYGMFNGVFRVGFVRLYPPNSLYDLPDEIFIESFGNAQDDEYNGMRAQLKGTPMRKVETRLHETISFTNQEVKFTKEYSKFNFHKACVDFLKANEILRKLFIANDHIYRKK